MSRFWNCLSFSGLAFLPSTCCSCIEILIVYSARQFPHSYSTSCHPADISCIYPLAIFPCSTFLPHYPYCPSGTSQKVTRESFPTWESNLNFLVFFMLLSYDYDCCQIGFELLSISVVIVTILSTAFGGGLLRFFNQRSLSKRLPAPYIAIFSFLALYFFGIKH